jgi:hypothetical protein
MGKMPNCPCSGDQFMPKMKSIIPTRAIMGTPFTKMNPVISASADIEESARAKNTRPDSFSLNFFIRLPLRSQK